MGCTSSSKTTPFTTLDPPISVSQLIRSNTQHDLDLESPFIHITGIAATATNHQLITPPFFQKDPSLAGLIHKIVAKKQTMRTVSKGTILKRLFEYYACVPFTVIDENNPKEKILVRFTQQCHLHLKLAAKISNLEYDPNNPNDLYGGGKPGTRNEMVGHPGSGAWWEAACREFDPRITIQSREGKFAFGFQRTVWMRTLRSGDRCAMKGKVVTSTSEEKALHGENVVVVLLGEGGALTNVDKEIAACGVERGGGMFSDSDAAAEKEAFVFVNMIMAPSCWVKTNQ